MTLPGGLLLAALLALPVWPILSVLAGWGGVSVSVPPLLLFYTLPLFVACVWIFTVDRFAGALGAYCLLRALPFPPLAFETTVALLAGLALYALARRIPALEGPILAQGIAAAGAWVAGYMLGEWAMRAAGLWTPAGGPIGNTNFVGAFLAVSAAVAPAVLLPLWVLGVAASQSVLAGAALATALLVRFRRTMWAWSVLLLVPGVFLARGFDFSSWAYRWHAWQWGLGAWWSSVPSALFGQRPGAWVRSGVLVGTSTHQEWFAQAHNEYLQLGLEGGLVALALVAGWAWTHRRAVWRDPWGPALVAIAIEAGGMFPFQVPAVALLCLLTMGLATREAA